MSQTPPQYHEIHSPRANLDPTHGFLVIQRCQRSSCFRGTDFRSDPKSDFMRLIMLNMTAGKCAAPGNTLRRCPQLHLLFFSLLIVQHSNRFLAFLLFVRLKSKHSPPSCWKVWFMGTENDHNTASVLKPNIYICSPSFLSILSSPRLRLSLCAADCRLNTGHAAVLLVERRGSYPLIDLRSLKSKSETYVKNVHLISIQTRLATVETVSETLRIKSYIYDNKLKILWE